MSLLRAILNRLSSQRVITRWLEGLWLLHICVGLCLALFALASAAQTQAGGAIDADTLWQAVHGPYIVNADIVIGNGAMLTIEPGTVVYMNAGVNLIVNNGSLRARGNASAPIIITSANDVQNGTPIPGSWGKIVFQDGSNDASSIIEWAQIRYGNGMQIESASPTLNYTSIRNHAGAAISMDLKSSPVGVGNSASGNAINGVSVPSGEIADAIEWRLKGIPYVVAQGELSVGALPVITSITPSSVQIGMSTEAVIAGSRLAGAESVSFDASGISAVISSGATDTAIPIQITTSANQPQGDFGFVIQTAAGKVRFNTGVSVIATKPTIGITSINPSELRRGQSASIKIIGTHLSGAQISAPNESGIAIGNLQTLGTQATFTLTASANANLGTQLLTVSNPAVANSTTAGITVAPMLPKVFTSPAQLSVSPDSKPRSFQLLLSNADTVAHTVNLNTYDPTIATVTPATINIPAGATQAEVTITGFKLGSTQLRITSPTLAEVNVQMYVTNLLNGAVIGPVVSLPVKVVQQSGIDAGPVISMPVGVLQTEALPGGEVVSRQVGVLQTDGMSAGSIVSLPVGVVQE